MSHVLPAERPAVSRSVTADNYLINALRAGAALMVVVSHARIFFLADFDKVPHNLVQDAIYALTALGHEAVVVFFVLSGYWVGGSAFRKIKRDAFRWQDYLADRLTRLWLVLIPALVITALVDLATLGPLAPTDFRVGDRTLIGFLGNLVFLGSIQVDTFGTNSPVWSLGYEFWMYVLGPVLMLVFMKRTRGALLGLIPGAVIALLLGFEVLHYLPLWMLGVGIARAHSWLAPRLERTPKFALLVLRVFLLGTVFGTAVAGRTVYTLPTWASDLIFAIPATALIASLVAAENGGRFSIVRRFSGLAHSSFSLYMVHMPLLALAAGLLGTSTGGRWASDPIGWARLAALVVCVVAIAWVLAWATERNTNTVRSFIKRRSGLAAGSASPSELRATPWRHGPTRRPLR